jgi:hypothetical protein
MRIIAAVLAALAALLLTAGVAEAKPGTYEVSGTWSLQNVNGSPTIIPRIQDDTVQVKCKRSDQVVDYKVDDPEFVAWEGIATDGRSVYVEPAFNEFGQSLKLTVTCRRA